MPRPARTSPSTRPSSAPNNPKQFTILYSKFIILCALVLSQAGAHESPEHNVRELTHHLQTRQSPTHLHQRAIAYRALGQLDKAAADLHSAITLAPDILPYHLELARIQLASNKPNQALKPANQALQLCQTPSQRANCHILRAEAYHRSQQAKPSLEACQLAFREIPRGEIEWFLLRSENQLALGHHRQRISDLKTGYSLHHSAVLKAHWVDAMIDASRFQAALPIINGELSDRRWKSSWLIKRARCLRGLDRNPEAHSDLHTALNEIKSRLNSSRPDPLLLADQGIIHALLSQPEQARSCLTQLKQINCPAWITARLVSMMAE